MAWMQTKHLAIATLLAIGFASGVARAQETPFKVHGFIIPQNGNERTELKAIKETGEPKSSVEIRVELRSVPVLSSLPIIGKIFENNSTDSCECDDCKCCGACKTKTESSQPNTCVKCDEVIRKQAVPVLGKFKVFKNVGTICGCTEQRAATEGEDAPKKVAPICKAECEVEFAEDVPFVSNIPYINRLIRHQERAGVDLPCCPPAVAAACGCDDCKCCTACKTSTETAASSSCENGRCVIRITDQGRPVAHFVRASNGNCKCDSCGCCVACPKSNATCSDQSNSCCENGNCCPQGTTVQLPLVRGAIVQVPHAGSHFAKSYSDAQSNCSAIAANPTQPNCLSDDIQFQHYMRGKTEAAAASAQQVMGMRMENQRLKSQLEAMETQMEMAMEIATLRAQNEMLQQTVDRMHGGANAGIQPWPPSNPIPAHHPGPYTSAPLRPAMPPAAHQWHPTPSCSAIGCYPPVDTTIPAPNMIARPHDVDISICDQRCGVNCPNGNCLDAECPDAKCFNAKCPGANCPKANCPDSKCLDADCKTADRPTGEYKPSKLLEPISSTEPRLNPFVGKPIKVFDAGTPVHGTIMFSNPPAMVASNPIKGIVAQPTIVAKPNLKVSISIVRLEKQVEALQAELKLLKEQQQETEKSSVPGANSPAYQPLEVFPKDQPSVGFSGSLEFRR